MLLKISVEYCAVWHYTDRATSLVAEILKQFETEIETVTLIPSDGGRFEIVVNDKLLYSKLKTGRHAEKGETIRLISDFISKSS